MNVAEQIIDSLENHLEEWEAHWFYPGLGLGWPWLMALHHPTGIKLHWSHLEYHLVDIHVMGDGEWEELRIYHKDEQQKVHDAFLAVTKRLREEIDIKLKEHDDKLRLRLKDKLLQL
jgi:hypothetical protein